MPPQNSETPSSGANRKRRGSEGQNTVKASDDVTTTANETVDATGNINAKVTPHKLCAVCTATISKSHLLNNRIHEINMTLSPSGYTERWEHFTHRPSLEALKASARDGCHLCTLLCTIVNDKPIDQVIEDEQREAEVDVPDPNEGYGPCFLSALNVASQVRRERQERRQRRMQQLSQIEDNQSSKFPGIVLQLRWGCSEWDERIDPKRDSFSINLELDWHVNYRMEINDRMALDVRPTEYVRSQGHKWKANRDDPIEVVHDAQICVSTESAASFNLASEWLARCKKGHPICRKAVRSASKFPKRLLDLGSGKDQTIRLRVDLGRKEFVSLSHRWGNSQPLRLLNSNIESFKTEINPDHLPRTFRDTVTITRKLGYRYLWIDSLCIIQDSKEDWMMESSIMGQIYRCSALNISTGGADDSNSGCFATREPLRQRGCILTGDATTGFCIRQRCPSEWCDSDGSSTISRGWIFQERMLAARTITARRYPGSVSAWMRPRVGPKATPAGQEPGILARSTWNPADKRPEFYDAAKYRAPSWSWACVDGSVRLEYPSLHRGRYENVLGLQMWMSYSLTKQFTVVEMLVSALPNGQVSYGQLVVEGRLRKMDWKENSGVKGFKHNKQARSISDQWSPDFLQATSFENWGLLLMTGTGSPNVEDARVDVIMALDKVKADKEWAFRKAGHVVQNYWKGDKYPIFQDDRDEVNEQIYTI
ncbi:Heterokaryon incompatibility protein (HET) domain containing protein [Elaphomyces granulatus]